MRRTAELAALLMLVAASATAGPVMIEGVAFTEGAAETVDIQVWALGEQVLSHPEWQFEAVVAGTARPGKPFSVDLGEARLPVRVGLAAEGHVAVALDVVFPEQLELPAAWLRRGVPLGIRVTPAGASAAAAVVWGRIAAGDSITEPWRWATVIPRSAVPDSGSVSASVPEDASRVWLVGLTEDLAFGFEEARELRSGGSLRLDVDSVAVEVRVWDRRGRPAPRVPVFEASSPAVVPALTDAEGRARIQVPARGQWSVVAVTDDEMARSVGSSTPEGAIELQLAPRQDAVLTWPEGSDPVVLELIGQPALLGGGPHASRGGTASFPLVATGRVTCSAWGPSIGWQRTWLDGGAGRTVLELGAPLHIDGRVTAPEGIDVGRLPVFVRLMPEWMMRQFGMTTLPPDLGLRRQWLPWAVTGQNGRFSLRNLPPGVFELEVRAPGFPAAASSRLTGAAGASLRVEIELAPGAPVTLAVVDPEGSPLEAVEAAAYRVPESAALRRSAERGDAEPDTRGMTAADGRTILTAVPVGTVQLQLRRPGYVTRWLDDITVPVEGLDLGEVTMVRGVTIRGTAVDPGGRAVPGAEVAMMTGPEELSFRPTTIADAEGAFQIPDLEPVGSVYLQARADGLVPAAPLKVELPPTGEVVLKMEVQRALEGVVLRAEDDSPLAGAEVSAWARGMAGGMMRRTSFVGRVTTGDEGSFRIDGLREGRYDIHVSAPGRRQREETVSVSGELDPDGLAIRLERGLTLRGRVETAAGDPASGLDVRAVGSSRVVGQVVMMDGSQARTGQDGSFSFDDLGPGSYRLLATAADGSTAEADATAGQDEAVLLRLEPAETVTGTVVSEEGWPVPAAAVTLSSRRLGGQGPPPVVKSGTDGRFRIDRVQPGPVTVAVEAEGFVPAREEAEVVSGVGAEVEIRLARGGTVVGVVRGLSGAELERTHVNSDRGSFAQPAADGSFELKGVEPGEREIFAHARASGRSRSVRVAVAKGGTSEPVVLDFSAGLTISGRVLRSGSGAAGMAVSATRVGMYLQAATVSGADGWYRIDGLQPGEYEIAARSRGGEILAGDHVLLETDTELDLVVAGGRLQGVVLEAETGRPVAAATVRIDAIGLPAVSRTAAADAAGGFVVENLGDGEYRVSAEAQGRSPAQELVTLRDAAPGSVTLRLEAEEATVFLVREADGAPAASVSIRSAQGGVLGPAAFTNCDSDGRCPIHGLPPGTWNLLVRGRGAVIVRVAIPAGELPVQLRPIGELNVTARESDGGAAWQLRVTEAASGLVVPAADWRSPGHTEWLPVTQQGFRLWLPAGGYRLEAIAPDGSTSEREVDVGAGATTEVVLE